jgi:hypothetical protein
MAEVRKENYIVVLESNPWEAEFLSMVSLQPCLVFDASTFRDSEDYRSIRTHLLVDTFIILID